MAPKSSKQEEQATAVEDHSENTTVLDIVEKLDKDDVFLEKQADLLARKRAAMGESHTGSTTKGKIVFFGEMKADRPFKEEQSLVAAPDQPSSQQASRPTASMPQEKTPGVPTAESCKPNRTDLSCAVSPSSLGRNQSVSKPLAPGAYDDRPGAEPQRLSKSSRAFCSHEQSTVPSSSWMDDSDNDEYDPEAPSNSAEPEVEHLGVPVASIVDIPQAEAQVEDHNNDKGRGRERERMYYGLCFAIAVMFLLVVVVCVVVLTKSKTDDGVSDNGTLPTTVPTLAPTEIPWTVLMPDSTKEALLEQDSPQALAFEWIMADPNLFNYTDSRILQRFALATFFYSTSGNQWQNQTHWLSYEHSECDWYSNNEFALTKMMQILYPFWVKDFHPATPGYPCDAQGLFRNLNLDRNGLVGSRLPDELYLLTNLQSLSLGMNELEATISSQVAQLKELESLWLGNTPGAGTMPTELGLLSNMRVLVFTNGSVKGKVPTEIGSLSNMEYFALGSLPELGGTMPSFNFPKVKFFSMTESGFTGSIPTEYGRFREVEYLSIARNSLTGTLPTELAQITSARVFKLDRQFLTGTLPTEFGKLTKLSSLHIDANRLSGRFPTELSKLTALQRFIASNNSFTGTLPVLESFTEPVSVDLSYNALSGQFPASSEPQSSLFSLNVEGNPLVSGTIPGSYCRINGTCEAVGHDKCNFVPGLSFDCTDLLCGCECSC